MHKRPGPEDLLKSTPELMHVAALLFGVICRDAEVFEFGSGGSTLWLARRADRVISIEDDEEWYEAVQAALRTQRTQADIRLVQTAQISEAIDSSGEWDVVFVDCRDNAQRELAVLRSRAHVKPGGWLVADDYNFPSVARAVAVLKTEGWDVAIVSGMKTHPVRKVPVKTATAFCRRLWPEEK